MTEALSLGAGRMPAVASEDKAAAAVWLSGEHGRPKKPLQEATADILNPFPTTGDRPSDRRNRPCSRWP